MSGLNRGVSGLYGGNAGLYGGNAGLYSGSAGLQAGGGTPTPPAATGENGYPGTFFGTENTNPTYHFGTSNTYGAPLGAAATVLGATQRARNITLPNFYIPASGDFAMGLAFWVNPDGSSAAGNKLETLFGVASNASTGGNGGGVQLAVVNTTSPLTVQGQIGIRRSTSAGTYKFWADASGTALDPVTNVTIVPGESYMIFIGRSGGVPKVAVVQIGVGTNYALTNRIAQTPALSQLMSDTSTESGTLQANTKLFDMIGAVGSGTNGDLWGFTGAVSDLCWMTGAFPTNQQAQDIARGVIPLTAAGIAAGVSGATLEYHNRLDFSTRSGTSLPATVDTASRGACTLVSSNIRGARVIRQGGTAITMDELYPGYTFPLAQGASTARVWFTGTCTLAGYPVQARLVDEGGTVIPGFDWQTITTSSVGAFRGYIGSVPKNQVFCREVRLGSSTEHIVRSRSLMQVGLKIVTINQSEWNTMATAAWSISANTDTVATGGHEIVPAALMASGGQWLLYRDSTAARTSTTQFSSSPQYARVPASTIAASRGVIGDGLIEIFNRLKNQYDTGLCLINGGKGGHSIDNYIFDEKAYTKTLTAHAGGASYSDAIILDSATMRTATGLGSNVTILTNWLNHIRPGTVTMTFPGGLTVTDSPNAPDTGQTSGNLYLSSDLVTPIGTIEYAGLASNDGADPGADVVITGLPGGTAAGAVTATWTAKQITQDSTYAVLGTFTAYSVKDWLNELLATELQFGLSGVLAFQSNSNLAATAQSFVDNWGAKYDYFMADLWTRLGVYSDLETTLKNPKAILPSKSRDTNSNYASLSQTRVAQHQMASDSGNANAKTTVFGGSALYDNATDLNSSPHPNGARIDGSARIGRLMGIDFQAFAANDRTINQGPKFGTPTISGDNKTWNVPATLGSGRILQAGYAGGWTKQTGLNTSVTQSAGTSNALDDWFMGDGTLVDNSTVYRAALAGDNLSVNITRIDGAAFTGTNLSTPPKLLTGTTRPSTDSVIAPPKTYVYDDYYDSGYEKGRLALPMA